MLVYSTPLLLERAAPQPGERVLDVACRTGIAARMAAPMIEPSGEITGVDSCQEMLAVARRSSGNEDIEWIEGPDENLPFNDRSFDLVLCQHGLEFFADRQAALREMRRVLDHGGRVAVSVWQALDQNPVMQAVNEVIARNFNKPVSTIAQSFSCGDADQVSAWLVNAGFNQIKIFPVTHAVRFKDARRFIKLLLQERTAIPVYAQVSTPFIRTLHQKIAYEIAWLVQKYTADNTLSFEMSANIFVAYR